MANTADQDQTAPRSSLIWVHPVFASVLKFVSYVRQLFAEDNFSRRHLLDTFFFQMHFFLAL